MTLENQNSIYSEKLLNLTRLCPECGTMMTSTGTMHFDKTMSEWFIEYWCPNDEEHFTIYTPESSQLVKDILK